MPSADLQTKIVQKAFPSKTKATNPPEAISSLQRSSYSLFDFRFRRLWQNNFIKCAKPQGDPVAHRVQFWRRPRLAVSRQGVLEAQ